VGTLRGAESEDLILEQELHIITCEIHGAEDGIDVSCLIFDSLGVHAGYVKVE
jgi:hypothetical protein